MTPTQAVTAAINKINPALEGRARAALRQRLLLDLKDALARVSHFVAGADDPSVRNLLRKTFELTVEDGAGDFTAALAAAEPPLLEYFRRAEVRFAAADDARADAASTWVPSAAALRRSWPSGYYYHALEGRRVLFRGPDGALGSLAGEAEVTSNYLLTDISLVTHRQLETLVVAELAGGGEGANAEG